MLLWVLFGQYNSDHNSHMCAKASSASRSRKRNMIYPIWHGLTSTFQRLVDGKVLARTAINAESHGAPLACRNWRPASARATPDSMRRWPSSRSIPDDGAPSQSIGLWRLVQDCTGRGPARMSCDLFFRERGSGNGVSPRMPMFWMTKQHSTLPSCVPWRSFSLIPSMFWSSTLFRKVTTIVASEFGTPPDFRHSPREC